jgi:hypothetical protein
MKTIYYFASYDIPQSKVKRRYTLAATTKIDYIISAINQLGYNVKLISASYILDKRYVFDKGGNKKLNDKTTLVLSPSFGTKTIIGKYLGIIFTVLCFFLKLLSISKNDTLFVYHAPWYYFPLILAKKIKRFRLVLEIEEIYANVNKTRRYDKMEEKLIISADAYLISTELLKNRIMPDKPFVVVYGRYYNEVSLVNPINDNRVHLIYAGIIDKVKAGAYNALKATQFLSSNYILHIIGFGDVDDLRKEIDISNKRNECKTVYDGVLVGNDYICYCQQCHIGLATQNMDGKFLQTSFPSKVLSYLSLGLNVVSGQIECVVKSKIGNIVNYYTQDNPKAIAEAIMTAKCFSQDELKRKIQTLHDEFVKDINYLINIK